MDHPVFCENYSVIKKTVNGFSTDDSIKIVKELFFSSAA